MRLKLFIPLVGLLLAACAAPASETADQPTSTPLPPATTAPTEAPTFTPAPPPTEPPVEAAQSGTVADVLTVAVSGEAGSYRFAVEIASPDTGCEQYADWWEVLDEAGNLLYRRILAHSHVNEQPFTRSGGPVAAQPDSVLLVRAHMNPGGYGGQAMQGTPAGGFEAVDLPPDFAPAAANQPPLPDGCAF